MPTPITSSTTIKSGLGIFALGLLSVAVLNACGGGDPVKSPASTTTATTPATYLTSSGTVSTDFVPIGGRLRYLIQGPIKNLSGLYDAALADADGTAGTVTQTSGAATIIGTSTLTSTLAVQAIKGNADYAQGRWSRGTATLPGGATALTGTNKLAFHYLALNDLTAFPTPVAASGDLVCTNARGTGASYVATTGTTPSDTTTMGSAAAYASVNVTAGVGMTVKVQVTVTAPTYEFKTAPLDTFLPFATVADTHAFTDSGGYPTPADGNRIILGNNSSGGVILGIGYRVTMDSGASYQGIISMDCNP